MTVTKVKTKDRKLTKYKTNKNNIHLNEKKIVTNIKRKEVIFI